MRSHSPRSAFLLVTHGSRDPRPQLAATRLARLVQAQLFHCDLHARKGLQPRVRLGDRLPVGALATVASGSVQSQVGNRVAEPVGLLERDDPCQSLPLVETAVLECGLLPLPAQIQQFAQVARTAGCDRIQLVPLFLLPGVHVMEDIPAAVQDAERLLRSPMQLHLRPYLGSHPLLFRLLGAQTDDPQAGFGRILLAHGSRRPGGNQPVASMAARLQALPAFWFGGPDLRSQVEALIQQGCRQIAIHPYFLFAGGITDAIAQQVSHLRHPFPETQLHLEAPLATNPEIASLITDLICS